jgi:hypothetical protein
MGHIGLTVVGAAFWAFLAISAVAGIVADYKKRRLELEPLRAAIERGQQLDPALVEHLMLRQQTGQGSPLDPIYFRVGGIVTVAAGIGVGILAFFINAIRPVALYPVLGAGVFIVCIGTGLLVCAPIIERHNSSTATRPATREAKA